jgi:hypothetical protein
MPAKVKRALQNVIIARAAWETVNEMETATKLEILNSNDFREEESNKRITEVNADFLMSESDFEKYCLLVYAQNCEKGFDSGGAGLNFWPIQKAVYDAEDAYIDVIATEVPQYTPEVVRNLKASPKHRGEFFAILGL